MAYVDVLSPSSYGRFNRKLAAIAGLPVAVYWSAILEVSTKVVKKKKYDEDGYFKLDRKYVEEITSIGLEDQLDCDAVLSNLKVRSKRRRTESTESPLRYYDFSSCRR